MAPMQAKIAVPDILSHISETYQPHLIGTLDSAYDIKLAKIRGPFIWHSHPDADELFYVVKGELIMGIRVEGQQSEIVIKQGEMFIVPQGVEHRPDSKEECEIMLIEKVGTKNTGNVEGSDRTREVADIRGQL